MYVKRAVLSFYIKTVSTTFIPRLLLGISTTQCDQIKIAKCL